MRFDFTDDQRDIQQTARAVLTARANPQHRRRAAEGGGFDHALWSELAELGWAGIAVAEDFGGQGLGLVELAILTEELGYACVGAPLLGTVTAALALTHAGSGAQSERWLSGLATGKVSGAMGLGGAGRNREAIADAVTADVLVIIDPARRAGLVAERAQAQITPLDVVDTTRGYAYADVREGAALTGDVAGAVDRATIVVAAELVGVCQAALDLTVGYAKQRKQFGSAIGSFQAIAHTAADMLRHTESARSATYYAAWTADHGSPEELALAASMAKAAASEAGRAVTAAAVQMHGAFGFSWESEPHWYFSRAVLDARALGGTAFHRARIAELVARQRVAARVG
ncbi:acyl-CoA dehydrogenase family protein [Nocardia sp. NBC_01388]|uniref:acyl-CoA dehydrogenase family protein n=1 Tax=Nocardia sp. NBC_01388 TaxID=2903596 RepID=UPI00325534BD